MSQNNFIKQASGLLINIWKEYSPDQFAYTVVSNPEEEMSESDPIFCKDCIKEAINAATFDFYQDRLREMGKVYELKNNGFYMEAVPKVGEYGDYAGMEIKKVVASPEEIKPMEDLVMAKYKLKTKFFSKQYNISGATCENFKRCKTCDDIFDYQLILTEELLQENEETSDEEIEHALHCTAHGFMLYMILNCVNQDEFEDRLADFSQRIVQISIASNKNE